MLTCLQLLMEGPQEYIPPGVLRGYDAAFRDELRGVIQRTQNPMLRATLERMLDCPIVDSRGGCRTFSDYILSALIKNGIHQQYDIEAALAYIVEKMLMPVTDTGEPRLTVFNGFKERPDFVGGNPLQARFLKFLDFAINNIRKGKIPRLANVERRPQGTVSIGQGRWKEGEPRGEISPDEIAAPPSTQKDLDDLVWDIKMQLRQKERSLALPLEQLFLSMMGGMRGDEQRKAFGDRTTRMARKVIIETIKSYAETSRNFTLLNMLSRFEDYHGSQPMPPKRQPPKVAKPVLSDKERDYGSIINVVDRLGRPVGSADLGRYRRRWLDYPPRDPSSGFRNRLEETLAAMTRDGVLRATRTAAGAFVYSLGPNADQYRGQATGTSGMPGNSL